MKAQTYLEEREERLRKAIASLPPTVDRGPYLIDMANLIYCAEEAWEDGNGEGYREALTMLEELAQDLEEHAELRR